MAVAVIENDESFRGQYDDILGTIDTIDAELPAEQDG